MTARNNSLPFNPTIHMLRIVGHLAINDPEPQHLMAISKSTRVRASTAFDWLVRLEAAHWIEKVETEQRAKEETKQKVKRGRPPTYKYRLTLMGRQQTRNWLEEVGVFALDRESPKAQCDKPSRNSSRTLSVTNRRAL